MNYKIYNNNSPEWVLLIHGLGGSINTWKYQIEDLKGYNILAVDLEGHGGRAGEVQNHVHAAVTGGHGISFGLETHLRSKVAGILGLFTGHKGSRRQ